jgi:secondary thiamine-phosphate synthase enzyme
MAVVTREISVKTKGNPDVIDLTHQIRDVLGDLSLNDGIVTVFVPGSTAGITTIEFESGVIHDLQEAFERMVPRTIPYEHNRRWGDGNGFSHVRAALCKPSLTIPFAGSTLLLGTWQQIVLVDFDNRPRTRQIILQFMGEE